MKLIIGLGNVGEKYAGTRHNIGFMVVDELAGRFDAKFKTEPKFEAAICELRSTNPALLLAKPTTMMNLSGQAVSKLMHYYKIDLADVWIVQDEVDIELGTLRTRLGGGSAGHNGIKSIIQHCGEAFWRYRLGVRNDHFIETATDRFVLDDFSKDESVDLPKIIHQTADVIIKSLDSGHPTDTSINLLA
jgi:PTH1 family peptidyl-tRNA hydrolase